MTEFLFADQEPSPKPERPDDLEPWHILVVDDEPSVHDITKLTLGRMEVFEHSLELHSAFSAEEAKKKLLEEDTTYCMAFVDVVMETSSAGLDLVDWIRNELKNNEIRLILRTGQAGKAPESEVIRRYDINDYRTKTDLTSQSLSTCVFNAVRGYRDITTISRSLTAFRKLIDTSASLLKEDNLNRMASSAFKGLLSILNMESSSLYITRREHNFLDDESDEKVYACSGRYNNTREGDFETLPADVRNKIEQAYSTQSTIVTDLDFAGYFSTGRDSGSVLYVEFNDDPTHFRANIVEVFATQAILIFENLARQIQMESTQKELLYIVGDSIEARSLETGRHVKRVSLFCSYIAEQLNQSDEFVNAIRMAAPLHDVGKITIPDTILHKPGKLTGEEWDKMKTHAAAGGAILRRSALPIARLGARLAHWHHENWDGSGYPDGLKGEEIPLEAQIMGIADVFDALGSKRSYKEPWSDDKILAFIKEQSGTKFDPKLVDLLEEHFEQLVELRNQFPD